jgi:hypothetical protein
MRVRVLPLLLSFVTLACLSTAAGCRTGAEIDPDGRVRMALPAPR